MYLIRQCDARKRLDTGGSTIFIPVQGAEDLKIIPLLQGRIQSKKRIGIPE